MTTPRERSVSLRGCTRHEAMTRVIGMLDEHYDAELRAFASQLVLEPGCDCEEIASRIAQLRVEMAHNRLELLARVAEICDEVFGVER
jgi:hypothetical protein